MAYRRSSVCGSATCVEVDTDTEQVSVRDSKNPDQPPLAFTREEWAAFVAGVKRGEFDA